MTAECEACGGEQSCPHAGGTFPARPGEVAPDAPPPTPSHPLRAQDVTALLGKRID